LSVAEELADRIGIIHRGRLIALGTPDELCRQDGHSGSLEKVFLTLTAPDADINQEPASNEPGPT
jgi:ABC-2 type transport system ATP-binding protein